MSKIGLEFWTGLFLDMKKMDKIVPPKLLAEFVYKANKEYTIII